MGRLSKGMFFSLASLAGALALMVPAVKRYGVAGGIVAFFAGAIISGLVASYIGIDVGGGCTRYSHFASDC